MPGYAYRVTPNQMYAVNLINKELGMDFHPTNKFMASEYIGKHYDKAKIYKAMREHGTTEIKCPHQHNCAYAGSIADYCYEEFDDDAPCSEYLPIRKEEQPCPTSKESCSMNTGIPAEL